jgi:hypothetical protein
MAERVQTCMRSCQIDWGHPYARCISLCDASAPANRQVWEPLCRQDLGSTWGPRVTNSCSAKLANSLFAPVWSLELGAL